MSSCSLYYLGGVFDRAAMISCGSDAVTDLVTGWIITFSEHGRCKKESYMIILSALRRDKREKKINGKQTSIPYVGMLII